MPGFNGRSALDQQFGHLDVALVASSVEGRVLVHVTELNKHDNQNRKAGQLAIHSVPKLFHINKEGM